MKNGKKDQYFLGISIIIILVIGISNFTLGYYILGLGAFITLILLSYVLGKLINNSHK